MGALPWGRETSENAELRTSIPSEVDPDSERIPPFILEAVCWPGLAWGFEGLDAQELS